MYKRSYLLLLTFIFTVLVASGCGFLNKENDTQNNEEESSQSENKQNDGEENDAEANDEQNNEESDTEMNADQNSNDETSNTDSSASDSGTSSTDGELPEPIEIDKEVQQDGVTFTLEKITFEDNHIVVDFNATNTTGHNISLAGEGRAKDGDLGGITLDDDTGYEYRYIAETFDHRISVKDNEEVTGSVSFAGKIQDDATSLSVVFNPDESSDDDRKPKFSFEDIEIKR